MSSNCNLLSSSVSGCLPNCLKTVDLPRPHKADVVSQPLIAWISSSCSALLAPMFCCTTCTGVIAVCAVLTLIISDSIYICQPCPVSCGEQASLKCQCHLLQL